MKHLRILLVLLFAATVASAQQPTDSLPYQRFPELPPLQLLLSDSATVFTKENVPKKRATLILFFSPGCSHCQHTAESLVAYKDSLPDVNIVMASFATISEIKDFEQKYHTGLLPHTTVGKDIHYLLPPFYGISNLPFLAFYDRKGLLAETFEGSMPVPKIADRMRELAKRRK